MKRFYSHGKLLLTAEYLVLDGALALAVPTKHGQTLTIKKGETNHIKWVSIDANNTIWFEGTFSLTKNGIVAKCYINHEIAQRLSQILTVAKQLNPNFLSHSDGYHVITELEFHNNWGLGTSSTLINNIANWANIDAYVLLENTFGGSGYDIACASANNSLTYQIKVSNQDDMLNHVQRDDMRQITTVDFNPSFSDHIYFVHLNQKQNSRQAIAQYRNTNYDLSDSISKINSITRRMISCESLQKFQDLMDQHEAIISDVIKMEPVKKKHFSDFKGSIKSLGAWGGDFVMVASSSNPKEYFNNKGYHTILSYSDMLRF